MTLTVTPTISDKKVTEISFGFSKPLSLLEFKELFEAINAFLNPTVNRHRHRHVLINYPLYENGEMIATVQKCSCGLTRRLQV